MAKVVFRNVTKQFGSLTAVDNLNLEIEDGEMVVLVGPSGCGKSTTLRMIAGLEDITSGEIYIGDRVVNDVAPKDRDIAMVFQNYALYPHMNVYDNIAFGLKLRKTPKEEIDKRVQHAADLLNIGDKLGQRPKQLSGGQRQRVAVGRAIVRQPYVFLFDEPLSNLDAKLRVHMRAELQELHRELSTTTIYVTHDQTEAMTLGSRVAVMKGGLLQQFDAPQHLYDNPRNVFVAGFIGSPAMNFLDAQIVERDGGLFAEGAGFDLGLPEAIANQVQAYAGQNVILGIRPEDFTSEQMMEGGTPAERMSVQVSVVEPLGSEQVIYGRLEETEVVTQLDPRLAIEPDQELTLYANTERLHLFDRETEESLLAEKPVEEPAASPAGD